MPAIVTNKFRLHNAKQFKESFDEDLGFTTFANTTADTLESNYYLFIGKVDAWSDDTNPPTPTDAAANTEYSHWRDMIAAKRILTSDVTHAIPRIDWTTGTGYYAYDDQEADLYNQNFYVMTDDYNVYKCLANNNGTSVSTNKPTTTSATLLDESGDDGYKWKFMYNISAAKALRFVTPNYIPVQQVRYANGTLVTSGLVSQENSLQREVEDNTTNGAIQIIKKTANGTGYLFHTGNVGYGAAGYAHTATVIKIQNDADSSGNSYVNSDIYLTSASNSSLVGLGGTIWKYDATNKIVYVNTALSTISSAPSDGDSYSIAPHVEITGDGSGAVARIVGNTSHQITDVAMIDVGSGYTNAIATITANTSHGLSGDIRPVISPKNGHGYDAVSELGGYYILLNSRLEYSESNNFTTNNDFRKIGLVVNPLDSSTGVKATATLADQAVTISLQNVTGSFPEDATVIGSVSGANGIVIDANSTVLRLADVNGTFNSNEGLEVSSVVQANSSAVSGGDLQKYSGDILYVENRTPVTRSADQIEDIKLIIEF